MSGEVGPLRKRLVESRLYYGWYVVVGCFLLSAMTSGLIFSFGVFLGPVLESFDGTYASTSLLFSLQAFVAFGGAAALGFAVDRYGVRRLLVVAAVLVPAGLLGASQAPTFAGVVVSYGVVAAAGLGITFVVAYTTPPRWFERRRGLATGVAVSGWGVGILAMPPLANALIRAVGWQGAYLVLSVVLLVAILVAAFLLADWPADLGVDASDEFPTTSSTGAGRDAGDGPEDGPEDDTADDPADSPVGGGRSIRAQVADAVAIVRTRLFGLVFVGLLLAFVPSLAVLVYLVEFAESVGVSRRIGVLGVSIIGALNVVAKFIAGGVADRVGTDVTLVGCVLLMFAATVLLVLVPTPASILVLSAAFGLGYGGVAALMSPLLANLFGTGDLSTLFGVTAIGFAISGTAVPYLVGLGFDVFGTYDVPFLAVAGVGLIGAVAFALIRVLRPDVAGGIVTSG